MKNYWVDRVCDTRKGPFGVGGQWQTTGHLDHTYTGDPAVSFRSSASASAAPPFSSFTFSNIAISTPEEATEGWTTKVHLDFGPKE